MKGYELVVLVNPDKETELDKALGVVKDLVKKHGGDVVAEDNWGKKKLAYPINGQNYAVYVAMDVELPASAPLKISSALNIEEDVMRYLLTVIDEKGRQALAEAEKAKEAKSEDSEK